MEKSIFRIYKPEEIKTMNYILGKSEDNSLFSKFELETLNKVNLDDEQLVNACKKIWANKDNTEQLDKFIKLLEA